MSGQPGGTNVSIAVDEEELLGLHILATMEGRSGDDPTAFAELLRSTLRRGIEQRLTGAGMGWPPQASALELARSVSGHATDASPDESAGAPRRLGLLHGVAIGAITVAAAVAIVGGYVWRWSWTGFNGNGQLWDWMHLLLLPVAFGTFPLWLKFSPYMSPGRRRALGTSALVFVAFAMLAYLAPLGWTGFRGQTLWDWMTLAILPLTLVSVRAWPESPREMRPGHVAFAGLAAVALIVTIVGGYSGNWTWTGFAGNTLWDWLSLALAPVAVTTFVVPVLVNLVTGEAEARAQAENDRRARELALHAARERIGVTP
jgi:hypothetical protein